MTPREDPPVAAWERVVAQSGGIRRWAFWSRLRASARHRLRLLRQRLAPPGSRREAALRRTVGRAHDFAELLRRVAGRLRRFLRRTLHRLGMGDAWCLQEVAPASPAPSFSRHTCAVDIVVCVHDALEDVRRCLESLLRTTFPPYRLILVDDGSGPETAAYLAHFAESQGATLLRNQVARGYTRAANQGLASATAEFVVLLNSDTITTHEWLDRLVACAESDPRVGLVGPLSNTASWQSVPEVFAEDGDWARNDLPPGFDPERLAAVLRQSSARLYPRLPFLNGFCLLLRRSLLETVGLLDEATFPFGYGEENDLCLRATDAGFALAVAEDVYVFHAQSRSYSDARRHQLVAATDGALAAKHGAARVARGVEVCRFDPVLAGQRARVAEALATAAAQEEMRERWEGRALVLRLEAGAPLWIGEAALELGSAFAELGLDVRGVFARSLRPPVEGALSFFPVPVLWSEGKEPPWAAAAKVTLGTAAVASAVPAVALDLFRPRPRPRDRAALQVAVPLSPHLAPSEPTPLLQVLQHVLASRAHRIEAVLLDAATPAPQRPAAWLDCWQTRPLSLGQRATLLAQTDVVLVEGTDPAALQFAAEAMACGAVVVGPALTALRARLGSSGEHLPDWLEHVEGEVLERLADDPHLLATLRVAAITSSPLFSAQRAARRLLTELAASGSGGVDG